MHDKLNGVYLITDTIIQGNYSHAELAEMAVRGGANLIQFRDKTAGAREALKEAEPLVENVRRHQALSIVNDRLDLAMAARAGGVHLGQDDLPIPAARELLGDEYIIGGSSSSLEEAQQVEADGADYVALGHIFETSTKQKAYPPLGAEYLRKVAQAVSIPLVAIGGITLENASEVMAAGADMIAVSSAICCADDPETATRKLVEITGDK